MPFDERFELGLTAGAMISLAAMSVPPPDRVTFSPCQEEVQCGDLSWQRSGHQVLVWTWDTLTDEQAADLTAFLFATEAQASRTVYVRSPKRTGWRFRQRDVRLFQAEVKRPRLDGQDGAPVAQYEAAYSDVQLSFSILAEVP